MTVSPGWIKFARSALTCKKEYGDGDAADLTSVENADGVPVSDERTYTAGTLIVSEKSTDRAFVTTGRALLKFITPEFDFRGLVDAEVSSVWDCGRLRNQLS